jgi:hypothetical protein
MWDNPIMITAKADDRKRLVLPQVKPGQVYVVTDNADGTITLSPVVTRGRKPGILDGLKPLTNKEAEQLYKTPNPEFDGLEAHCAHLPTERPDDLE